MTIMNLIITFTIIWWLVLFMVLPLGRSGEPVDEVGAPKHSRMGRKVLITTVATIVVTAIVWAFISADLVSFRQPSQR